MATGVITGVQHNPEEPGTERRSVKRADGAKGREECLLRRVCRVFRMPQCAIRQVIGRELMPLDEAVKGVSVSALGSLDPALLVVHGATLGSSGRSLGPRAG